MLRILRCPATTAIFLSLATASVVACGDDADTDSVSTTSSARDAGDDAVAETDDDAEQDDEAAEQDDSDTEDDDDSDTEDDDDSDTEDDDGDDDQSAILDASVPNPDIPDASATDTDMVWESEFSDASVVLPKGITVTENDEGDVEFLCGGSVCACSDGVDNDGDGTQDGNDSECTGPFDNDEGTFATGISGDNKDGKWQDCFFDGNSGAGDDGCRYHTDCLTGDLPEDHPDCVVTQQCVDYCQPLAPPGCDCFGCCEVQDESGQMLHIIVGESCSMEQLDDERACPRCEPTTICENECGECEICLGMTHEDLPDSCTPPEMPPTSDDPPDQGMGGAPGDDDDDDGAGGDDGDDPNPPDDGMGGSGGDDPDPPPSNTCDNGATACFDNADCASGQYCSLGCCKTAFRVR